MNRGFFDVRTPFFRPLWRRVLVTGLCLGWALAELSAGELFWAALFGAAGVYLAWQFFVAFGSEPEEGDSE